MSVYQKPSSHYRVIDHSHNGNLNLISLFSILISLLIFFFREGSVMNSAISLVLYAVQIFLSLPRGTVTFS